MNKEELKHKVHSIVSSTLKEKIYISPVELLMKIGVLSALDYEDWRFGRVPYLEKVCKTNLSKLSFIMKELRAYALENHLKSSWTAYNQWGVKGKKIPLCFSKSGDAVIEEAYATHYVVNFLSGTFVIRRCKPCPGAKMLSCRKHVHINTYFRDQSYG